LLTEVATTFGFVAHEQRLFVSVESALEEQHVPQVANQGRADGVVQVGMDVVAEHRQGGIGYALAPPSPRSLVESTPLCLLRVDAQGEKHEIDYASSSGAKGVPMIFAAGNLASRVRNRLSSSQDVSLRLYPARSQWPRRPICSVLLLGQFAAPERHMEASNPPRRNDPARLRHAGYVDRLGRFRRVNRTPDYARWLLAPSRTEAYAASRRAAHYCPATARAIPVKKSPDTPQDLGAGAAALS